ncbi:DUF4139 domain-containing protein [Mesoterricola sediminis]|uniref:DUF4139 domain-containing protein n=1 Tax=Mesoterricola sediminis TaxID=2927980 RepID=A0AA48GXS4_9BACT|nr:DUF4139 domain-containing protein [Mesoterricola sediminis]BDU75992.1 DUF4139 domain-containing protein [Mesoterricola sediminis]
MRPLLIIPALPALLVAQEPATTLRDNTSLAVTIYNDNLALVKDQRKVALAKGDQKLAFQEVSAKIRPETALLRNLTAPTGFWVAEQNFDFDLLTPQKLLEKYVGDKVTVVRTLPNPDNAGTRELREEATVLATNNGVVLQFPDRIETSIPGRLVFPKVPGTLRAKPTLVVSLHSGSLGPQQVELSYLTTGLSWRADYVANLTADESALDLNAWVTLTNQSGAAYPEAKLQLVAGDVHTVKDQRSRGNNFSVDGLAVSNLAPPRMKEEGLFEYHLYTLEHPTTIADNQTKQVALLSAQGVPIRKEYQLDGDSFYYFNPYPDQGDKLKVAVYVLFDNREAAHLGMPLPKGILRMYKRDAEGRAQFIGEDRIDHTPKWEVVKAKMGEAFDLTARRKQTDYKRLERQGKFGNIHESAFEVELRNAKKEPVTVKVIEPMPGDWEVIQSTHPCQKIEAGKGQFMVTVPPEGAAKLTYRVRVKW